MNKELNSKEDKYIPFILLIEPISKGRLVVEAALKRKGYQVTSVENAEDALPLIERNPPGLILSEIHLGGASGFSLCRALKEDPKLSGIPFVILTEEQSIDFKVKGLQLGVTDFLVKPIFIKELTTRIEIILHRNLKRINEKSVKQKIFTGNLEQLGLIDLLQTIELGNKTGYLKLDHPLGMVGMVYFQKGQVIDAELGMVLGETAIMRMMFWKKGRFHLRFGAFVRERKINRSNQSLLMEGLRQIDEYEHYSSTINTELNVVLQNQQVETFIPKNHLRGIYSIKKIISFSQRSNIETLTELIRLKELNAVHFLEEFPMELSLSDSEISEIDHIIHEFLDPDIENTLPHENSPSFPHQPKVIPLSQADDTKVELRENVLKEKNIKVIPLGSLKTKQKSLEKNKNSENILNQGTTKRERSDTIIDDLKDILNPDSKFNLPNVPEQPLIKEYSKSNSSDEIIKRKLSPLEMVASYSNSGVMPQKISGTQRYTKTKKKKILQANLAPTKFIFDAENDSPPLALMHEKSGHSTFSQSIISGKNSKAGVLGLGLGVGFLMGTFLGTPHQLRSTITNSDANIEIPHFYSEKFENKSQSLEQTLLKQSSLKIKIQEKLLKQYTKDSKEYLEALGLNYLELQDLEASQAVFEQMLESNIQTKKSMAGLSKIYFTKKQFIRAMWAEEFFE